MKVKDVIITILLIITALSWYTFWLSGIEIVSSKVKKVEMVTKTKVVPEEPVKIITRHTFSNPEWVDGMFWKEIKRDGCSRIDFELNITRIKEYAKEKTGGIYFEVYFTPKISVRGVSIHRIEIPMYLDDVSGVYLRTGIVSFTIWTEDRWEGYESDYEGFDGFVPVFDDVESIQFQIKIWRPRPDDAGFIYVSIDNEIEIVCWTEEPHTVEYQEPTVYFWKVHRHLFGDEIVPACGFTDELFYINGITHGVLFIWSFIITVATTIAIIYSEKWRRK